MANKIVSTIHSTATPSLFLRATSAIHGDLGLIQNEAPVAAGSKINAPKLKRKDPQLVARLITQLSPATMPCKKNRFRIINKEDL